MAETPKLLKIHNAILNGNVHINWNTGETTPIITIDNGVGFIVNTKKEGIGLLNIKARAKLIGAEAMLTSAENKGTNLEIKYNYE